MLNTLWTFILTPTGILPNREYPARLHFHCYHPRSKASEGIFLQASVCPIRGGAVGNHGPGHNTSLPPRHRSQHLPSPQVQVTTPPSPLGTGHNTSLPLPSPQAQVTAPPPGTGHNTSLPPGHRSQHLPPPWAQGHNTFLSPPGLGYNTSLTPWAQVTNTSLPPLGTGHNTSFPPGTMRRRAVRILLECILVIK